MQVQGCWSCLDARRDSTYTVQVLDQQSSSLLGESTKVKTMMICRAFSSTFEGHRHVHYQLTVC